MNDMNDMNIYTCIVSLYDISLIYCEATISKCSNYQLISDLFPVCPVVVLCPSKENMLTLSLRQVQEGTEETRTLRFQPGQLGMSWEEAGGRVMHIAPDGQAKRLGVKEG